MSWQDDLGLTGIQRFDVKTVRASTLHPNLSSPCIEWTGYISASGYGLFRGVLGKTTRAHRFAWEARNGKIPSGLCVCHKCDNRKCVRIDHLFLGTHTDNAKDRVAKGRSGTPRGESNVNAKLTREGVNEIVRMRRNGVTFREIAKRLGVAGSTARNAVTGKTWRHLTKDTVYAK